eukprot:CAMPEP_0201510512 /NCGR_PEP_ID=MMETSP0161_2-20130828/3172_1 /ASSEMBLY_ACC=CAM_ASM_000251 /TAXON_ID=180227 /ORGANISM="Neoparamoeba aestuarina, Strain SoJaBio B1-5/56/2" /LENGTH=312 /DNA_ID=CAMNT_0047905699 /DNA_START=324 /DNA_END=1262 /DNA_ORIENTATION=+
MNNDNNPGAIDVWAQHPTHRFLTNEVFASLNRWNKKSGGGGGWGAMGQQQKQEQQQQQEQLIELVCNPDTTVSQMDEAKVDKALICAWYNHSGEAWISNEEVMKFASQHPSRLLPVLSHSFLSPLAALQEIRGYFEQTPSHSHPKPVGVRIIPWLLQTTIDNARFYPIFAYLCEHRIPLFIQVGWTGPLRSSEYGRPIPYLENVLLHFPELIVVCGHIGQPWLDEVIFLTSKFENVYIDTSAYKPSRFPPTLIDFMKSKRGSKKVMYGTNYPMISFQDSMKGLDLDDETKALYLRGNAERVLFNNNKNPSKL